ncbi:MAG: isoleucine--tRNA ligase [Candidatus Moranbacteria bacterium CG10_big_fil_rev_8_21_14_0_10_35_21]|nr:MAG: isoleucine--tRNA ligase [Candidatus Moranbacteria bacterium CG10_big_fil_rev_8_21_14_0_10_35_21]PJA88382.1 MAG: isoleucine--tRNA ligase [Candidatus Moranbacteria bacterium CG_4_9_14_3_um_filter_36_9]
MAFKQIDPKMKFPQMEEGILKFWDEEKIFEKSVEKNSSDKSFVFYEGPPTANGQPGLHHVLARAFKDIIPRYKTMKGYRVERKAGWDTHGLPVELQVEKEMGLKNKQEIENIVPGNPRESIIEFNKKCKESVWKYKDQWEKLTERMGYWVDMKNPYITYKNKYIESVWWVVAQIFKTKNKKGESLIYKGHKVVPYCYRCGTTLSSHEVAQGYQMVKDNSIYVKFKAKPNPEKGIDDNTYFLAWTTTPWTLPGNVALAVNKEIEYVKIKCHPELVSGSQEMLKQVQHDSCYILAKNRLSVVEGEYKIAGGFLGKNLLNLEYEPLYNSENKENKKVHYVVSGDFVSTSEGTGIVHIAPAFGEDDANVGRENNLPTLLTVDETGKIISGFNIPGEGLPVKKKNERNKYAADELIIEDLKERGLLLKEELYEHEYPFCWRCDTPLIYYAKPSWFIQMSELSSDLGKNNENINWIPEYIKEGRFGEWLLGVKDWAISRERYWGTPLPIWECAKCGELKVIESISEMEKMSGQKLEDLHKPYIDDVKFKCVCGEEMKRVPEVLDVWFDSGSMPLAQFSYPNQASKEDKKKIESGNFFPADYISEAIDQTRGWFYTLHAIATLLNKAGKVPAGYAYKNVICLNLILDSKGKKMSKSKGNIVDPMEVMDKYGADMLRWMLFTINQPGMTKKFDIKGMNEIMNRVFRMLWNSYSFFVLYANIDQWETKGIWKSENLLDKWIISELNILIKNVDEKLESYDVYGAAGIIEKFVDNLSNWYIRRSRKRFWKSEDDGDKESAYQTLHMSLMELSKLMAPFTPFISEEIYKNLTGEESVHLVDFPVADEKLIDEKLNENMGALREIITLGLQDRAKNKIKVRQPLKRVILGKKYESVFDELINKPEWSNIIIEELNVKGAEIGSETETVAIDIEITPELKLEGQAREIIRFIQTMRKEADYVVDDHISVGYVGGKEIFEKFNDLIAKEVLANEIKETLENFDLEKEFDVDGEKLKIQVKK